MDSIHQFLNNLERLQARIKIACDLVNRPIGEVELMAVTKTHPAEAANWALAAGLRRIGENRVQEAAAKRPLANAGGAWELIGPLQSNKARLALETVDRIQTVDRLKLVQVLDRHCAEMGKTGYPVLMQVNVGKDPAKHGCLESDAAALAEAILSSKCLSLEGFMTIGELTDDEVTIRRTFSSLRSLRDKLEESLGLALPVLSMGMTDDLEWAIAEGSTLIRVGTALFGGR
ncbi:MAG TPA: YggS family pyridoxal phosphate-dependent enzyme [Oceanipulchritudo sp.]|nr:YggS family pyridoxal phosphate-dependent enzyme [Oceanipulchritudo sp.]